MRLLVFSHSCVEDINRKFFAEVAIASGWSITVVIPANWRTAYQDQWRQNISDGGPLEIEQHQVAFPGMIPLHFYRKSVKSLLNRHEPDAIYVHHEPYGLATAQVYFASRSTRRVPIGFYTCQNINKRYPLPIQQVQKFVFRNSSFAFTISGSALDVLREKGYHGPAEVLSPAIDQQVYYPHSGYRQELQDKYQIRPNQVVFGYVGRLVEEKGLETLVKALALLPSQGWRCFIVGSGPWEHQLRQLIAEKRLSEQIQIIGYIPHLEAPRWLSFFDVLILPSETRPNWKEQFGRVVVEAMACGTPVIGSDSGEIPRLIRTTGGGLTFPERDVSALRDCLARLAGDASLRASLAAAGRTVVAGEYDQRNLARRFVATIDSVYRRGQMRGAKT